MDVVGLVGLLLLGVVVLTPVSDRIGVPQPVVLVLYGLVLGFIPGIPAPDVPPELILPLVLPPLLFAATQTTSVRELRDAVKPILGLAVGLTLISIGAVTVIAHAFGLPWGVAVALGAIVAPPDPVAASAVASRLRLPQRLVTILEGEGQFNDATALVVYQQSLIAIVAGSVTVLEVGRGLLVAVLGGTALGVAAGFAARYALRHLHDPASETTVTVALPFAIYLAAERLEASGVLAVVFLGLVLRSSNAREMTSAGWLLGRSVWQYTEFAVSGLVFAFLGLELVAVLGHASLLHDGTLLGLAAAVLGGLFGIRSLVMSLSAAIAGRRARRQGSATPYGWRESAVASWSGMRGVVTVATALALPMTAAGGGELPFRGAVVVVALIVVFVTLVGQGLTLAPLIRRLGVASEVDMKADVRRLHRVATEAALDRLREAEDVGEDVRTAVMRQYESRLGYRQNVLDLVDGDAGGEDAGQQLRGLLARATEAERDAVLEARRTGRVSPAAADDVLFDVEARALRYES